MSLKRPPSAEAVTPDDEAMHAVAQEGALKAIGTRHGAP